MRPMVWRASRKLARSFATTRRTAFQFEIVDHIVSCQHTRHYPGGTEPGHENELRLQVKQYIPLGKDGHATVAKPDDVTLVGAHANGFPKELYEPLWDDLTERLRDKGRNLRSIWIADMATQGQSGVLNENIIGDDPNWWDHARDLLFLINQKQGDMPQPLMGIGHSVGASHLAAMSLLHPRLLQALVLIDPVIQTENPSMQFAPASTYRRDVWSSRSDAAAAFQKSKFYQQWDRRVLENWIKYGLRELPTELHPHDEGEPKSQTAVTLTTTKAQEVYQYLRPLYKSDPWTNKDLYADFDPDVLQDNDRFYRPEPRQIFNRLPEIFPPVQYIFGAKSPVATSDLRQKKLETTGSGIGGNGGLATGRVNGAVLDCGHLVAMEMPTECASIAADFFDQELNRWTAKNEEFEKAWRKRSRRERIEIDDDWKHHIGPPPERPKKTTREPHPSG